MLPNLALLWALMCLIQGEEVAALKNDYTNMTCCGIHEPPFFLVDKGEVDGGLSVENMGRISKEMTQRGTPMKCARYMEYQNRRNDSGWTSAIDHIHHCSKIGSTHFEGAPCICDMMVSHFVSALIIPCFQLIGTFLRIVSDVFEISFPHDFQSLNHDRRKKVSMIPINSEAFYFVTSATNVNLKTAADDDILFLFKGFSWQVWILILLLLVGVSLTMCNLLCTAGYRQQNILKGVMGAIMASVEGPPRGGIGIVAHNQGDDPVDVSKQRRFLVLLFIVGMLAYFSNLFLNSIYNSAITGGLLDLRRNSKIRGIRDFERCSVLLDKIAVLNGSVNDFYINEFVRAHDCHKEKGSVKPVLVNDFDEGFRKVADEEDRVLYYFTFGSIVSTRLL